MSTHALLSPGDAKLAAQVLQWADDYLTKEHHLIKRPHEPQTVCPFVGPSINNDAFYMVFHNEINGRDPYQISNLIVEYIEPFKKAPPFDPNQQRLKALLICFPRIEDDDLKTLDFAHELVKPAMVDTGLMVGQFHKRCGTPAVHNPEWQEVSRSEVPLIAMRNMAPHDIMFLENDKDWFKSYNVFWAHYYRDRANIPEHDKHLIKYYERARARYSR